ncbi:hypothetical protein KSS87_020967 [Heliosperma pusillum]|nr:hypothetical protein KSS87_020967 [Heliosperma pusillum]
MPENLKNHSNSIVNSIKEGISRMKISKEFDESIEYPYRPGEPDCMYYLRNGRCNYGTNCHFNHPPRFSQNDQYKSELLPQREGKPDCGYFIKTGSCKYGAACKFHHPPGRRGAKEIVLNSLGLPLRKEEKACPFYMKNQTCMFGSACKFDHPEPASAASVETALPAVSGAITAVGTGAYLPSPGIPYVGSLPAWPWTSSSYLPGQPAYMPYIVPALQGAVATPYWNSYLGNSSVMGMNLVYTSKNRGELLTGGQADCSTMANLPQRPDQPEGEDTCAHFSSYGICRSGPTCKYNHPIAGYISGYYFGMPFVHQPYLPSRKNLTIANSTETSRSKSVKITDWIQKPETRHNAGLKLVEDSPDDDQTNAAATAEIPQDQSD